MFEGIITDFGIIAAIIIVLYLVSRPRQLKQVDTGERIFFDHIPFSTDEFYTSVEEAIESRKVPNVKVRRILLDEGTFSSAKRQYLRIERRGQTFDVCAAPFASGFFVSWRLGVFGKPKENKTYYQIDTDGMYKSCIKACINEAIDTMGTEAKGIRNQSPLYRIGS